MGKTIADIRRKYRSINLLNLIDTVIRENEHVLIGLVRSQLSVGESAVGQLPQYKSLYYAKKKQLFGSRAPFGITDLILTGSFTNKFYVQLSRTTIKIKSSDFKSVMLGRRYGPEIYKLNRQNLKYYVEQVLEPGMNRKLKAAKL